MRARRATADARIVGNHLLIEKLAAGGMGTVFKAKSLATGELVAVKLIDAGAATDPEHGLRFARECQALRSLNHPHVVRALDFGIDGNQPFMIMELVDGESVGQLIEHSGYLPEGEAVRIALQIGRALHWAHGQRLVHRDVKPDNILITVDGDAKLADLGLVKNLDAEFDLTRTLSCLGTPNFMAPEQFEDARKADALSDQYSLGATLYMMVTGAVPFVALSSKAIGTVFRKKMANELKPPRELVPELSEHVAAAILRATRASRKERFPSMLEFLEALTAPKEGAEEPMPSLVVMKAPAPDEERRRKKRYPSGRKTMARTVQKASQSRWPGVVVDLSPTGLCMQLARSFEPGTLVTLVLEGAQSSRRLSLLACVRWRKAGPAKGTWQMGCEFDQPLAEFELEELL